MMWLEHDIPKTCCRCGQTKTWADFPADPTTPDGLAYHCKSCKNAATRARYHRNPEWARLRNRDEYRRNGKRRREGKKQWQAMMEQLAQEHGLVKKQPTKGDAQQI